MIPVREALSILDKAAIPLRSTRVALADSVGRVLAEDIVADTDLPPFDRSQMDGYAVRSRDSKNAPVVLQIIGESAAGKGFRGKLKKGEAVRIMTGAPVPDGADAVQKLELASESASRVTLAASTEKGRFIVTKGKEVKRGTIVLAAGSTISAQNISVPAAFGYARLKVARRPRITIVSTGSEIVEVNRKLKRDQIRNSNSQMLASFCRNAGCEVTVLPILRDDIGELQRALKAAAKTSDVLIATGGVSVGKYDLTKPALEKLGAEIMFDRVALRPGKPTVFAKLGKTFVFGLPGNPVSAAVTFYLFVRRFLMQLQNASEIELNGGRALADGHFRGITQRDSYLPAELVTDKDGHLIAKPIKWHGSSDFVSFARSNALVFVQANNSFDAGDAVDILFLPR